MSFTGEVLMVSSADKTDASFESDPPYEFGWAKEGTIAVECVNWGNIDNTLVVDVYWGVKKKGFVPVLSNLTFEQDTTLTKTIAGTGGVDVKVAGILNIPIMKSKFMKLVFTLAGTTKEVDVTTWFYGKN